MELYEVNGDSIGLNGVVLLVTVSEEHSHVTSPIWSREKVNRVICFFHKQVLKRADIVVRSSRRGHEAFPTLDSRHEKSKWLPPFWCMDISFRSLNVRDSCIA